MKCNLFGTVVGRGVIKSKKDGKEYPWVDVYADGDCVRVFGYSLDSFPSLSEGEVVEWPVRVSALSEGRLSVRYLTR